MNRQAILDSSQQQEGGDRVLVGKSVHRVRGGFLFCIGFLCFDSRTGNLA